jgi:hypothetical protein
MQKETKLSLLLLIPAAFGFLQALYLPHFTGVNRFQEFINYLNFRGYLFLLSTCVVALGTLAIIVVYRPKRWFVAVVGIVICCFVLDIVYVWSARPNIALLNSLLYDQTDDGVFYIVNGTYIWITAIIAILTTAIGALQGFVSRPQGIGIGRRGFSGLVYAGLIGSIAVLPLPIIVYFLDPSDWTNHVTLNGLSWYKNADLFYTLVPIFLVCLVLSRLQFGNRSNKKQILRGAFSSH